MSYFLSWVALSFKVLQVEDMFLGVGDWIVIGFVLLVVLTASRLGTVGNLLGQMYYSRKEKQRQNVPTGTKDSKS